MTSELENEYQYLTAVSSCLPADLQSTVNALCSSASIKLALDALIRFTAGAKCSSGFPTRIQEEWSDKQRVTRRILDDMIDGQTSLAQSSSKRTRDNTGHDGPEAQSSGSKRRKLDDESGNLPDEPLFTLHSISTTSPVRKKVDITIHDSSIRFTNSSSRVLEAIVPKSSLKRAFLLPTRGKQKPHWTVVLLSSDVPDRSKSAENSNPQIIFGLDATTPTQLNITIHVSAATSEEFTKILAKGSPSISAIREFLTYLPEHCLPVIEPSLDVFRSATAGSGKTSSPAVEGYLAAKSGSLWFLKEGILWGEGKPCEFWAMEDLFGRVEGVRMVSATGRTCSVFITRKGGDNGADGANEDDEDLGVETEFGMVDGREQEPISAWVRRYRHLFGDGSDRERVENRSGVAQSTGNGSGTPVIPMTIHQIADESDVEDEDFQTDPDSSGEGSTTSEESDQTENDGEREGSAENSGEDASLDESNEEEDEKLKEEHHPLMRPGAMPRMSKASISMVVDMVEGDMFGQDDAGSENEEDELES